MFSWVNFLTYVTVTSATPGPNNILSMNNGGQLGLKKSYRFNLGIFVGFFIVAFGTTMLSHSLHAALPVIKKPMLILGALYLLYLAWTIFRSSEIEKKATKAKFISGLLLQFINPQSYLYSLASMEAFVLPYYQGNIPAITGFVLILTTIVVLFTLAWAMFGQLFHALFTRYRKITNTVLALLLVYCAISLFF